MIDDDVWTRRQEDIRDEAAARDYDTPATGMFAAEVLGPTVDRLVALAAGGRALELAVGTGRVAVPLHERGVPVAGIELSAPMIAQLRTKAGEDAIPVVHGDLATARVDGEFSLVYLVFNTISNQYDVAAQRMVSIHVRYDERRGDARVVRGPFRHVWPAELDLMARLAGMEREDRWADWGGAPFTHESTSHVTVYRRV